VVYAWVFCVKGDCDLFAAKLLETLPFISDVPSRWTSAQSHLQCFVRDFPDAEKPQ
jgi:hypothetical protein